LRPHDHHRYGKRPCDRERCGDLDQRSCEQGAKAALTRHGGGWNVDRGSALALLDPRAAIQHAADHVAHKDMGLGIGRAAVFEAQRKRRLNQFVG